MFLLNGLCWCCADQIGSAIPKLCWDATHGHTLGGGNFWTTGYQAMMDAIAHSLYKKQQLSVQAVSEAHPLPAYPKHLVL